MNEKLVIEKLKEIDKVKSLFITWVTPKEPAIMESERGKRLIAEINNLEVELAALESSQDEALTIMERLILKGKTNDCDIVKQYCFLAENKSKGFEKSIIIHRLILTENAIDYFKTKHILLRKYKDKYLFTKSFSMKVSTMEIMLKWAKKH